MIPLLQKEVLIQIASKTFFEKDGLRYYAETKEKELSPSDVFTVPSQWEGLLGKGAFEMPVKEIHLSVVNHTGRIEIRMLGDWQAARDSHV